MEQPGENDAFDRRLRDAESEMEDLPTDTQIPEYSVEITFKSR